MQMSEVGTVVEARGIDEANKKLADGWTLLAVVPGTIPDATSHVVYVLGKPKAQPVNPLMQELIDKGAFGAPKA